MKRIKLTRGFEAMVDDEDFEYLNQWKWHIAKNNKYAARREYFKGGKGKSKIVYMHRQIMNPDVNKEVDHINGDGLDNRKSNLRSITSIQNHYNHKILSNNKSGYNGVSKTRNSTWHTCISVNNKTIHVGTYKTPEEAALAYNEAARIYYGEFARLNNI